MSFLCAHPRHHLMSFKIPYGFQQHLSSSSTPVLTDMLPAIECLMTAWEALTDSHLHLARFINASLQKLREGYNKTDQTQVYVMALGEYCPCFGTWTNRQCRSIEPRHEVFAHQEVLGGWVHRSGQCMGPRRGELNISHSMVIQSDRFNGCVQLKTYCASSVSGGSSPIYCCQSSVQSGLDPYFSKPEPEPGPNQFLHKPNCSSVQIT